MAVARKINGNRDSRPSDMKERILKEAIRLFGQNGFHGTSLQTIADAVGIRKPSLLYHFGSKDELREEVLEDLLYHWTVEFPKVLSTTTSGYDRFTSTIRSVLEFFIEDENRARLSLREMLDRPQETGAVISEYLGHWTKLIVNYIEMGQNSGVIKKDVDPEAYIMQITTMVIGTVAMTNVISAVVGKDDKSLEPKIDELVRIARESLFHKPDKAKKDLP